ncbi:50S ribosomal protein L23 [Porphyromonas sp. COT-239 OH1446]|uniref:50S ribosomal protein L23 n=1 Tax=Porphyromonas sp. COT-239 OH1446 TaxID=1515613 RepID=UPI00052C6C03|nr:50S ribosomal protein L23 [Porphyromonas sp. COT-239 OH1446]KGN70253.1 50S ribosomal protein L23 [Porphyromonas sp. COT-239 OH1446]
MRIIIKPIISEKSAAMTEKTPERYAFKVVPSANKIEIKNAIEAMYNVKVESVNTMNYSGKRKARYTKSGLIRGKVAAFKKAVVTLKEGQTIDFYANI